MNINDELDLRHWFKKEIGLQVQIQWVEPAKYGSTVGVPDCYANCGSAKVGIELKIWERTKNGIKCKMRPIQRRWHHMNMKSGGRSAVLAHVHQQFILVRGDHIPLRDYASHKDSGCSDGQLMYETIFMDLPRLLFDESYGFWL